MNNFDENKEFVRRPSAQQTPPQSARPQTRPTGTVQRPAQGARPQARPSANVQRQAQMPSQARAAQQKRPTRPAPQRGRIAPDGQQKKSASAFCGKNVLIYFAMLAALLLVVGAILFSALSTTKATPQMKAAKSSRKLPRKAGDNRRFFTGQSSSHNINSL